MSRTWLSIRVDLVEGRGEDYGPRPGRISADGRRIGPDSGEEFDDDVLDERRLSRGRLQAR